jgi:putative ABC transport system ATP-binding protein
MELLRLENVHKSRPGPDGREIEILRGISLVVQGGRLSVIIGPSGGGKSTLVRLVNRLDDPSAGRILLDGADIAGIDPLALRRRAGLVPQKPFMFDGSVLENLQRPFLFRRETPPAADAPEIGEILHLCRIESDLLSRQARTLSLGQQQRVSIARTLITGPDLLLLDEPTSALDRPTGDRLADTLREISRSRNLTILMVTHDLRLAERIADDLSFLADGLIVEVGDPGELLNHPRSDELRRFLAQPEKIEG